MVYCPRNTVPGIPRPRNTPRNTPEYPPRNTPEYRRPGPSHRPSRAPEPGVRDWASGTRPTRPCRARGRMPPSGPDRPGNRRPRRTSAGGGCRAASGDADAPEPRPVPVEPWPDATPTCRQCQSLNALPTTSKGIKYRVPNGGELRRRAAKTCRLDSLKWGIAYADFVHRQGFRPTSVGKVFCLPLQPQGFHVLQVLNSPPLVSCPQNSRTLTGTGDGIPCESFIKESLH
jgi:hypothetical protein